MAGSTAAAAAAAAAEVSNNINNKLGHIPLQARIRVVYLDEDVAVIHKPGNLRSVPGNRPRPRPPPQEEDVADSVAAKADAGGTNNTTSSSSKKRKMEHHHHHHHHKNQQRQGQDAGTAATNSAREAWIRAIESFRRDSSVVVADTDTGDEPPDGADEKSAGTVVARLDGIAAATTDGDDDPKVLRLCLARLAAGGGGTKGNNNKNRGYLASIPRKYTIFRRYLERNRSRIMGNQKNDSSCSPNNKSDLDQLARRMFWAIEARQRRLLPRRPEATADEESAIGQLKLLLQEPPERGNNDDDDSSETQPPPAFSSSSSSSAAAAGLFPVHRLDCATSGLLAVARTADAAAALSAAWRCRPGQQEEVRKTYRARVADWPPLQHRGERCGEIHLPLAPRDDGGDDDDDDDGAATVQWRVVASEEEEGGGGKPSRTLWRVVDDGSSSSEEEHRHVTLELTPVTGRTHQLRLHCAAVSASGIVGDAWYGRTTTTTAGKVDDKDKSRLYLHAYKLSFPHPRTGQRLEFVQDPDW